MTPERFKRSLATLDPCLNLRWGSACETWVVERKGVVTAEEMKHLTNREARLRRWIAVDNPNPKHVATWKSVAESLESGKRGYRVVIQPEILNQQTYDMLVASDIQRYGGYAAFADMLDARDERAELEYERQTANKRRALNAEVWDMMRFVNTRKETQMLHGITNMGMLLHGKQSKEPLIRLTDF